jgi:hypothetical protein
MTDESLQERRRRAALNQSQFRRLNESINQLHATSAFTEYECECTQKTCEARVSLSADEYEEVRGDPTHFVVATGHVLLDAERVVRETPRYQVVEKLGIAAEVAVKLDPRAGAEVSQ